MDGEKDEFKKQKYNQFYMDIAERVSQMSYAVRLKVGSVLVKDDNIISYGWNGTPKGWDNNCEDEVLDNYSGFEGSIHNVRLKTKPEVIHSESNCLSKVAKSTISSEGATLFCTHAPCIDCAKMIHQAGIFTVYYRDTYKNELGLDFLIKSGVNVTKYQ
jgi:dCMP deaminase